MRYVSNKASGLDKGVEIYAFQQGANSGETGKKEGTIRSHNSSPASGGKTLKVGERT